MTDQEKIKQLIRALRPFAQMDREGDGDLDEEVACQRGTAGDMTLITSGDFRRAAKALREVEPAKRPRSMPR